MGIKTIKIMLDEGAYVPERAHELDAGYDLRTPRPVLVRAHDSASVDTGVHVEIPPGYVGFLMSKSGLNMKHGLTGTGTIDAGYTGSICATIHNHSDTPYLFAGGDKIIQLVLLPIITPDLEFVDGLEETERGSKGFGSTGY